MLLFSSFLRPNFGVPSLGIHRERVRVDSENCTKDQPYLGNDVREEVSCWQELNNKCQKVDLRKKRRQIKFQRFERHFITVIFSERSLAKI